MQNQTFQHVYSQFNTNQHSWFILITSGMPTFFRLNLKYLQKVAREIFFYFTYSVDVNVTLHTFKLKMAVEYEIVIKFAVN